MPFHDSLKDRKALVSLIHLQGHWIDAGPLQSFSTESCEQINVWPASGDLQVKGHPQAAATWRHLLIQPWPTRAPE